MAAPSNSTIYILYVVPSTTITTADRAVAEARRVAVAKALQVRNITVVSYVVRTTRVPNVASIHQFAIVNATGFITSRVSIMHVTVATTRFNMTIPSFATNVSFAMMFANVSADITALDNVEQTLFPYTEMGAQAGMLAGLVAKSGVVAVWYDPTQTDLRNGVRAGLIRVCPLCTLKSFALCSGSIVCPGQVSEAFIDAIKADVIVTAFLYSDTLPKSILALNSNDPNGTTIVTTPRMRRIISAGNLLNDLSDNVSSQADFLGNVAWKPESVVDSIIQTANGAWTGAARTVQFSWTTDFSTKVVYPGSSSGTSSSSGSSSSVVSSSSSTSALPHLTEAALNEFIFNVLLFNSGGIILDYDVISVAQSDNDLVGGPPFIPVGHVITGIDLEPDGTGSVTRIIPHTTTQAAFCTNGTLILLLSSDLTTVTVYNIGTGQWSSISVNALSDQDFWSAGNGSAMLREAYNVTERVFYPAAPRGGVACNAVGDTFLLTGGYYLNTSTGELTTEPVMDVLRLVPFCLEWSSESTSAVPFCNFYLVENVSTSYHDSSTLTRRTWDPTPTTGGVPLAVVGGAPVSAPTTRVYLPNYLLPYVRSAAAVVASIVNETTKQTIAVIRLLPPTGIAASAFVPVLAEWIEELDAFMAVDLTRLVIVLLFRSNIDAAVATILSNPTGNIPSARWVDVAKPLPSGMNPLCIFYNRGAGRFASILTPATTTQPYVYHYSTSQSEWIFQAKVDTSAAPTEQYVCIPLNSISGGSALLVPAASWRAARLTLVWYPTVPATCSADSAETLDVSQLTCNRCDAGYETGFDGFCIPTIPAAPNPFETWMIALTVVVATLLLLGVTASILYRFRRRFSVTRQARLPINAPPSGLCSSLFIAVSDADLMWVNDMNPDLADGDDEPFVGMHMKDVMEKLEQVLCKSVAANRCYLTAFRGETAVIVGASAFDLLCVAVEVTSAFAMLDQPVRISCGLHTSQLIQDKGLRGAKKGGGLDGNAAAVEASDHASQISSNASTSRLPKYTYVGHGLHVATKLSGISKKGRVMVTPEFVDDINDGMLKHLGIIRGDTISLQIDATVVQARELVIQSVSDAFDALTAVEEARLRRKRLIKERKHQISLASKQPAPTTAAAASNPLNATDANSRVAGLLAPPRAPENHYRQTGPREQQRAAPAAPPPGGDPLAQQGAQQLTTSMIGRRSLMMHNNDQFIDSSSALALWPEKSQIAPLIGVNPFAQQAQSNRYIQRTASSNELPPLPSTSTSLGAAAAVVTNISSNSNGTNALNTSVITNGRSSSTTFVNNVSSTNNASKSPCANQAGNSTGCSFDNPVDVGLAVVSGGSGVAAALTKANLSATSNAMARVSIPNSHDTGSYRPLSASNRTLTIMQEESLMQLANAIGRTLLGNLISASARGREAFKVLSARLHLPTTLPANGSMRGMSTSTLVTSGALRVFAQRVVLLATSDLSDVIAAFTDTGLMEAARPMSPSGRQRDQSREFGSFSIRSPTQGTARDSEESEQPLQTSSLRHWTPSLTHSVTDPQQQQQGAGDDGRPLRLRQTSSGDVQKEIAQIIMGHSGQVDRSSTAAAAQHVGSEHSGAFGYVHSTAHFVPIPMDASQQQEATVVTSADAMVAAGANSDPSSSQTAATGSLPRSGRNGDTFTFHHHILQPTPSGPSTDYPSPSRTSVSHDDESETGGGGRLLDMQPSASINTMPFSGSLRRQDPSPRVAATLLMSPQPPPTPPGGSTDASRRDSDPYENVLYAKQVGDAAHVEISPLSSTDEDPSDGIS